MSLEIVQREQEGIEIVDLKGRLTFGPEDLHFRSEWTMLAWRRCYSPWRSLGRQVATWRWLT